MKSVRIRDVSGVYQKTQRGSSLIRVSGMYQLAFASISDVSAASPHLPPLPAHPDVVKLGPLQRRAKHLKKQKVVQVQVESLLELKQFLLNYRMPDSISIATLQGPSTLSALLDDDGGAAVLTEIQKKGLVYVMQMDAYDVEGVCLTGPQQIQWIGQLAKLALRFVLHIDSKWKLHHGVWVLTSLGTHMLKWDQHHQTLSTTFVPLIYLVCKQHESTGAALMVMDALNAVSEKYFGVKLEPGGACADHCDAFRNAYETTWPGVAFGTCWPHIARKFSEGEYTKKTWAHFDEVKAQLQNIHLAHSAEMRDALICEYSTMWDEWGDKAMNKFWDTYCINNWDCWSIGLFDCMLMTPSQQAQESWHKQILR